MKMKFIFLVCILCFYAGFSLAQDTRLKYTGIETGIAFIESEVSDLDYVRADIPSYYGGYTTDHLTSINYKSFIGIKSEIFSLNDRFGLSGGIRFSSVYSCVSKNNYWTSSSDFFYCLSQQDSVNTEYLKVKEINQTANYLGIPIEFRFFPAKRPHLIRIFFHIGADINILVQTKKDIVFYDDAMNPYKEDLTAKVEQPNTFYSSIYTGGGLRIGRELKPSVSIEAWAPYFSLPSESSGLVNPIIGGGFQITVQVPIKSKAQ